MQVTHVWTVSLSFSLAKEPESEATHRLNLPGDLLPSYLQLHVIKYWRQQMVNLLG